MREYRRRKRLGRVGAPTSPPSPPSIVRAPESSSVPPRVMEKPGPQRMRPNTELVREGVGSRSKAALELARTFPFGLLASRVCPYCYNTGYSSPGTRCSYCRSGRP